MIDGGSTDGSADIIRRHESRLAYSASERDKGQTDAINKGLRHATGEILAYLNSDDYYLSGTLKAVAEHFRLHADVDLVHGRCRYVDKDGTKIGEQFGENQTYCQMLDLWNVWWNADNSCSRKCSGHAASPRNRAVSRRTVFVMDYDYWLRDSKSGRVNRPS